MSPAFGRLQFGGLETENVGEEGGKKEIDIGGIGGRVCSSIGVFRQSNGTGGSDGEGVEEYKWRNLGVGGGD
jgi:hypothetical protein